MRNLCKIYQWPQRFVAISNDNGNTRKDLWPFPVTMGSSLRGTLYPLCMCITAEYYRMNASYVTTFHWELSTSLMSCNCYSITPSYLNRMCVIFVFNTLLCTMTERHYPDNSYVTINVISLPECTNHV